MAHIATNQTDRAWLHLIAAVCWLVGAILLSCTHTIRCLDNKSQAALRSEIALGRAEFLSIHDCDEHLRLPHTVSDQNESAWVKAEAERNEDHRRLCEKLKIKVADLATRSKAIHKIKPEDPLPVPSTYYLKPSIHTDQANVDGQEN